MKIHASLAVLLLATLAPTASASSTSVILHEPFDYGATGGALAGQTGGFGFSGAWVAGNPGIVYDPDGLTFSNLLVHGGKAFATGTDGIGNSAFYRDLAFPVVGVLHGSYLSRIQSSTTGITVATCVVGPGMNAPFSSEGYHFATPFNADALVTHILGDTTMGCFPAGAPAASGGPLVQMQTYLTLFEIDTTTRTATAWLLTEPQFDTFKAGGLTVSELDTAPLGPDPTAVTARVTYSETTCTPVLQSLCIFLNAFGGTSASLSLDEVRIGNSGLDEVTPLFTSPMVPGCFPGTGGVAACPCGQPANPVGGCANFGAGATSGAALFAWGNASVAVDGVHLVTYNHRIPPAAGILNVFFTGQGTMGTGVPNGAGVRCVSTALKRLYTGSTVTGTLTKPGPTDPEITLRSAALGVPISAGQTRHYFTIYRDTSATVPCGNTASNVNVTNAGSITWGP